MWGEYKGTRSIYPVLVSINTCFSESVSWQRVFFSTFSLKRMWYNDSAILSPSNTSPKLKDLWCTWRRRCYNIGNSVLKKTSSTEYYSVIILGTKQHTQPWGSKYQANTAGYNHTPSLHAWCLKVAYPIKATAVSVGLTATNVITFPIMAFLYSQESGIKA